MANAQLEQEIIERKNTEAVEHRHQALVKALRDMVSTLDANRVLDIILLNLERVIPHDAANIMLIEGETVRVVRSHGDKDRAAEEALLALRFPVEELRTHYSSIDPSQSVAADTSYLSHWRNFAPADWVRSDTSAPISLEGEIIGFINLESATPRFFTREDTRLLSILADHAAIAIHNARLYERAQTLATTDERQRIANDLHDTVAQTLWSAAMVADVLPGIWEGNRTQGLRTLARLRQLTRGALAEMRNLLLELRPNALTTITLEEVLRRLIGATTTRTGIEIVSIFEGECSLQPNVQLALYRIVREALNNACQHALADRIVIELDCQASQLVLRIRDDGEGFNPENSSPDCMGLTIMRERARSINAALSITSEVGHGTEVVVVCPLQQV